jgi:hypothetical protein
MISKIKTAEEIAKKTKKKQILVGIVMIGLLVISTLGYSLMSSDGENSNSKVNELGINFIFQDGLWRIYFEDRVFGFQHLPSETSLVDINGTYDLGMYVGEPLYFVNPSEGVNEILNNIGGYVLRYQEACINNIGCGGDLPVKNCSSNLIIFDDDGFNTSVHRDGGCVFISGDSSLGADAFLYKVLKII